jgi:transaldolase/glucose-6-phosphate isomerase
MNPLKQLEACGQSPWLDNLKRSLIETGALSAMIGRDGLKGITSNPSIFEKAIADSGEYEDALRQFQTKADRSVAEIYEHLAFADIRAAADVLRPVYDATGGGDGYISLECSPYLANDTAATIAEGLRLWAAIERPNLMVKVPATEAGIPAIRKLIGAGVNINITLLFSISAYGQVAEAYMAGLEDYRAAGGDAARLGSVASIFVSRIDSAIEKKLDGLGDKSAADGLRGKVAIANAKMTYQRYLEFIASARWKKLAAAGAKPQRLLWASTSTKNPAYKDTLYVEALIGRDTVDTLPPATMDAFRDHGIATPDTILLGIDDARTTLAALKGQGISLDEVCADLVADGVQQFADSFDKLFGAIARKRRQLTDGDRPQLQIETPPDIKTAIDAEMEKWRAGGSIRRLWAGDASLWTGADESKWLGWLTVAERELADAGQLKAFAQDVKTNNFTDVVLLGMGGSSLGPEVFGETFGVQAGWPRLHVLDSTDPAQVRAIESAITLDRTMFIVSSKSGGTLEPNSFLDYFFDRVIAAGGRETAARQFAAVTDPGSSLEKRAKQSGFAHIFYGEPAIGGRYSVLSKFGLVPAVAMGLDIERLLQAALSMQRSCGADVPPAENPAVQLGVALGVAAKHFGRDKITIVASPKIADLGAWLEQLIAESTGKHGRGLIPIAGEPLAAADRYGIDRFFVYLELDGHADAAQRETVNSLARAGHPIARIAVKDVWHIGQEFFRWETATAVAGAVLGIDPFDQPDVEASKVKTSALMAAYEKSQKLPQPEPIFRENGISLFADPRNAGELGRHNTLSGYIKSHFGRVKANDYIALLAYIERSAPHTQALTRVRARLRDKTKAATCVGFGPRFLHSTGQAYKGGPNTGVFLQITCDDAGDFQVPGHGYSFGLIKSAQAAGDLDVLVERGRRALRIHFKNVDSGLAELGRAVEAALE